MLERLERIVSTKWFMIANVVITFFFWVMADKSADHVDVWTLIGYSFFFGLVSVMLVLFKNTSYLVTPILCSLFVTGVNQNATFNVDTLNNAPYLIVFVILVVSAFIYHFIRFKVKLRGGALTLGLLLIAIGYVLSFTINDNTKNSMVTYILQVIVGPIYLFIYLLLIDTSKETKIEKTIFLLFLVGILISLQFIASYARCLIMYVSSGDAENVISAFKYGISNKWEHFELGYGVLNDGAMYLAFFMPTSMYYICKRKNNWPFILVFVLQVGLGLISVSRGGYIGIGISFILSAIVLFKYASKTTKIAFGSVVGVAVIVLVSFPGLASSIIERFKSMMGDNIGDASNGRFELYRMAIEQFIEKPFVGGSFFANISDGSLIYANRPIIYHSTIFHVLGTMGLVGVGALIFHLYQVGKLFKKKFSFGVLILLVGMVATHIHGLIDNTFYMVNYMIITILIYVAVEKSEPNELIINTEKVETL